MSKTKKVIIAIVVVVIVVGLGIYFYKKNKKPASPAVVPPVTPAVGSAPTAVSNGTAGIVAKQ